MIEPVLEQQLCLKLNAYFEQLAAGQDVSPAERYRLEGYLQAVLEQQHVSDADMRHLLTVCGAVWSQNTPLPLESEAWRLPCVMHRAPVS